jgi:peroxiredoxin Q/BCP
MNNRRYIITGIFTLVFLMTISATAGDSVLQVGDKAPAFVANDQDGDLWTSDDRFGKGYVVIYFYPAAMTSGCTAQACSYRDHKGGLDELGIDVVGISGDPVKNLKYFQEAENLNFTLLSDVSGEIATKFGVPLGGGGTITRTIHGAEKELTRSVKAARWTFVVDPQGKIVYKDTNVDAGNDSNKVTDFVRQKLAQEK